MRIRELTFLRYRLDNEEEVPEFEGRVKQRWNRRNNSYEKKGTSVQNLLNPAEVQTKKENSLNYAKSIFFFGLKVSLSHQLNIQIVSTICIEKSYVML